MRYQEKTLISVPFGTVWSLWSRSQKIMVLVRRDFFTIYFKIYKIFFSPKFKTARVAILVRFARKLLSKIIPFYIFGIFFAKLLRVTRAKNVKTWSKWRIIFLEINAKLKFLT